MYFFFHLFTGIILGFLISDLTRDRRWILPCIAGAVIPDIIDKPLNFIFFPTVNGDGRFLFHNLILLAIVMVAGLLLWRKYSSPVIFSLGIGVLSHQILDSMWMEPVQWLFPLLGPYPAHVASPPDHLLYLLATDLTNPLEWLLLTGCAIGLLVYWNRRSVLARAGSHTGVLFAIMDCMVVLLGIAAGIVVACGLLGIPIRYLAVSNGEESVFTTFVILLAVILVLRWKRALKSNRPCLKDPGGGADLITFMEKFGIAIGEMSLGKKIMIAVLILCGILLFAVFGIPFFTDVLQKILVHHRHLHPFAG